MVLDRRAVPLGTTKDRASTDWTADRLRDLAGRARALVRTAVLTDAALPDPDRRYTAGPRCALPESAPDPNLAYDAEGARAATARAARFKPSRVDIERCPQVMAWLAWLKTQNDGRRDVEIIVRRAFGTPMWKLASRFGRSDETIRRWEAGAYAAIVNRYWRDIERLAGETPP
ncbi:DUF6362 family protein [Bauldia sp.]|uniref:DUF6362 family protein n=1 Tax=Bauldia sp. TaxID=2575872 RepID=UPI003BA9A08E